MNHRIFVRSFLLGLALCLSPSLPLRALPHGTAPPEAAHAQAQDAHGAPTQHDVAGASQDTHHAPPVKLFGFKGPELGPLGQYGAKLFNFLIFAGILFFVLKGTLMAAFKARTRTLEDALAQAAKDKAEGEAQVRDLAMRMADLERELADIMAKAEAEGEDERQRIVAAARAEAEAILAQAQAEIAIQRRLAERELRALVTELAVQGATQRLEALVQGATAARVMDHAIGQIGGSK